MSQELSEFFINKAKIELREDEGRKQQSYEILKDWLLKHPFIKILDPDCLDLDLCIPFLRAKKYTMEKVYEASEKTLLFVKQHQNWSDFQGENLKRAIDLYESGYIIVSKECDSEGRKMVLCSMEYDTAKFNSDDVFRLSALFFSTIYRDEETQIGGITYIGDARATSMNYIAQFSIRDFYAFISQMKMIPIRFKKMLILGLPTYASQFMNIAKSAYSEKMNKRLFTINDISELSAHVDVSLLPKEFGGKYTKDELMEDFKIKMIANAESLCQFFCKYEIDFAKVGYDYKDMYNTEMIGTFRKLEID